MEFQHHIHEQTGDTMTSVNITSLENMNVTAADGNDIAAEQLAQLNVSYAKALLPVTVCLALLGFTGIVGNLLVFYVYGFGKKFRDEKFRCYVLVLAIIDFTTCLTLIPAEIWKHQSYFNFEETIVCKLKCFFNVFAASAASYCLFIVSLDRYILTCHPFLFVKIRTFSHNTAWPLCILMVLLGVLTAVPAAILCGKSRETMYDSSGRTTDVYVCSSDPYFETGVSRFVYRITLVIMQIVINILMIILYAQIGCAVKKVMVVREACSHDCLNMQEVGTRYDRGPTEGTACTGCHSNQANIPTNIKLLFLITLVFIATYSLYMGLSWVDQTQLTPAEFAVFSVFFRLYFIHSVINPFLYAKMDKYFRKRCLRLFKRRSYY